MRTRTAKTSNTCKRHGCNQPAEFNVMGIPLCMIDWLRVRVDYNLEKIRYGEKRAA